MIKKILKIAACATALFGIFLTFFATLSGSLAERTVDVALTNGIGVSGILLKQTFPYYSTKKNSAPEPYTYIDLPRTGELPVAAVLYDKIPNYETGQDSPDATTPPGDDNTPPPEEEKPELKEGEYPIVAVDMSEKQTVNNLIYKNESKYSPDVNSLASSEYPLKFAKTVAADGSEEPLALIIHTHGTECYLPDGASFYTDETPTRSNDPTNNVVAVGEVLADVLNRSGVPTIHCETMFDAESYSGAYDASENAVIEYIKKYPSIQYVFDVHRDSIVRSNKEKIKAATEINGKVTAQAMFVVGTNSLGADHPDWIKNLTVASIFQYSLVEKFGSLMRPINLRAASFNAEHAAGSILIEIGTCGNTLSEAKECARLLGKEIAKIIISDGLGKRP